MRPARVAAVALNTSALDEDAAHGRDRRRPNARRDSSPTTRSASAPAGSWTRCWRTSPARSGVDTWYNGRVNDPRVDRLAELVVGYSLGLGEGRRPPHRRLRRRRAARARALPLRAPRRRAPVHEHRPDGLNELLVAEGSDEQLAYISPDPVARDRGARRDRDHLVGAEHPLVLERGRAPARRATSRRSASSSNRRWERISAGELRWCGTLHPDARARAGRGHVARRVRGVLLRAPATPTTTRPRSTGARVASALERARRASSPACASCASSGPTPISASPSTAGRGSPPTARSTCPDGEVFTSPVETGTEGEIRFTFPAVFHGPRGRGRPAALRGRPRRRGRGGAGRGVPARAARPRRGRARSLGEVAFGLNYEIDRFTRNILLDEKIGGTMHLALGAGFAQAGGRELLRAPLGSDLRPARGRRGLRGRRARLEGRGVPRGARRDAGRNGRPWLIRASSGWPRSPSGTRPP